jgi:AraC-like DNA-binding protein
LLGFSCWGRPDVEDVRELLRACEVGLGRSRVPYRWLVDLRELEVIEPSTFAPFLDYTKKNRETLRRNIVRQAQLHGGGFVGAVISGFARVARLPYPDRVFGEVLEALAWLEVERETGLAVVEELEAIRAESRGNHSVVARLRGELELAGAISIERMARRFGQSTRTLQRALREAGTTYSVELTAFRLRRAEELMKSDRPLAWIASEVGFSTAQHFATAYKRARGATPTEWRGRQKASPG